MQNISLKIRFPLFFQINIKEEKFLQTLVTKVKSSLSMDLIFQNPMEDMLFLSHLFLVFYHYGISKYLGSKCSNLNSTRGKIPESTSDISLPPLPYLGLFFQDISPTRCVIMIQYSLYNVAFLQYTNVNTCFMSLYINRCVPCESIQVMQFNSTVIAHQIAPITSILTESMLGSWKEFDVGLSLIGSKEITCKTSFVRLHLMSLLHAFEVSVL